LVFLSVAEQAAARLLIVVTVFKEHAPAGQVPGFFVPAIFNTYKILCTESGCTVLHKSALISAFAKRQNQGKARL
jgi:hypothetical protein